jgi:hypothetical protein
MISPVFKWVNQAKGIPIRNGSCLDEGFSAKVLDKTFSAFSYSLDVELYSSSYYNNNEEN